MLMVKTKLALSEIAGIGLFAAEDIVKGTVTWRLMPRFDLVISDADLNALPEPARSNMREHVYFHARSGLWVLCADNARFMNHANEPNTAGVHPDGSVEGYDIATRDIRAGEELTCDYRTFDADAERKLGPAG
jgi:uncharacterized protein